MYEPTYTDVNAAQAAVQVAIRETAADMNLDPDQDMDEFASDLVAAIAMQCDKATALELCRMELGFTPGAVRQFFGGRA